MDLAIEIRFILNGNGAGIPKLVERVVEGALRVGEELVRVVLRIQCRERADRSIGCLLGVGFRAHTSERAIEKRLKLVKRLYYLNRVLSDREHDGRRHALR